MVWIALILLASTAVIVLLQTNANRWGMYHWRFPRRVGPSFDQYVVKLEQTSHALPWSFPETGLQTGIVGGIRAVLDRSGFYVFTNWFVFTAFLSFLLPIWSLSFATDALGSERESRTLVWLLTRPLPRFSIYLAKFIALLPWGIGLNLFGFGLICLAAGKPGLLAFRLYWPAVIFGSLALCSLFHLLAACFRRATVIALVYVFFLEIVLGILPGQMKRVSISYYIRCIMYEEAQSIGVQLPISPVFLPIEATTACVVLMAITIGCLLVGMLVFSRTEYQDLT